jgi:hypothetical protein
MAAGVPETEVFKAADAVLARGERPTVERVRLELGRGSPARVGQLLEQWWEQLARRLKGHVLLPDLPGDVAQAFAETWRLALAQAQAMAQAALVAEQNALFAEHAALTQERKVWDIALAEAQATAADHATERALAERQLTERQILVEQLSAQATDLVQQRDRLQSQIEQLQTELSTARRERADTQAYVRTIEDRAHQQVDHARQELKALQQQQAHEQREHARAVARVTTQQNQLRAALQVAEQQSARLAGHVEALEATKTPSGTPTQRQRRPKKTP